MSRARPFRYKGIVGPSLTLPPGTLLGAYEVVALIGAGGMGEVYRGRDTRLDRMVATHLGAAFLLAGRYTLLEQESLQRLLPLCEKRGIGIVLGGPYNSGILASGAKHGATYNYINAPPAIINRVAEIERVCRRHKVKLPEAALAFPLLHPAVVSIIPGAVTPRQVKMNVEALRKRIPKALWRDFKAEGLMRADAPVK